MYLSAYDRNNPVDTNKSERDPASDPCGFVVEDPQVKQYDRDSGQCTGGQVEPLEKVEKESQFFDCLWIALSHNLDMATSVRIRKGN